MFLPKVVYSRTGHGLLTLPPISVIFFKIVFKSPLTQKISARYIYQPSQISIPKGKSENENKLCSSINALPRRIATTSINNTLIIPVTFVFYSVHKLMYVSQETTFNRKAVECIILSLENFSKCRIALSVIAFND